jgi:hypothetical protein
VVNVVSVIWTVMSACRLKACSKICSTYIYIYILQHSSLIYNCFLLNLIKLRRLNLFHLTRLSLPCKIGQTFLVKRKKILNNKFRGPWEKCIQYYNESIV